MPTYFYGDIVTLYLRKPTKEEQITLGVVWIAPTVEEETQYIRRNIAVIETAQLLITGKAEVVQEDELLVKANSLIHMNNTDKSVSMKDCKELLWLPSDEVVEKKLEVTTHLYAKRIEMEGREIPRQH